MEPSVAKVHSGLIWRLGLCASDRINERRQRIKVIQVNFLTSMVVLVFFFFSKHCNMETLKETGDS